jgi:hypothetical protein
MRMGWAIMKKHSDGLIAPSDKTVLKQDYTKLSTNNCTTKRIK